MARLPSSFRNNNRTTRDFRELFANLSAQQRDLVKEAAKAFHNNPNQPGFRLHRLRENCVGEHLRESWSVSITMRLRAIFVKDGDGRVWYWVGTHAQYDRFTGS